jgi:hypothetical protein
MQFIAQPRDRLKFGDIDRSLLGQHVLAHVNDGCEDQGGGARA